MSDLTAARIPYLILTHETAMAGNAGHQDCRKLPLDALLSHETIPSQDAQW